jgi:hypothetical protein
MARIAAIALTRGCPRLDWLVTDGNPASDFYRRLDAGHMDDQLLYRLRGEKLRELADEAD